MNIRITNLNRPSYNAVYKGETYCLNITDADVEKAIDNKEWEYRSFQECFSELRTEWESAENKELSFEMQKQYHVRRIATIKEKELGKHPLLFYNDRETLLDGGHRLWAMKYLNRDECDGIIVNKSELSEGERKTLWETITKFEGDAKRALEYLRIPIIE